MINKFNKLHWHDAKLHSIHIDRNDPGKNDRVVLVISWPSGKTSKLIFSDCYALKAQMNFGVIAEETINDAEYKKNSEELDEIKTSWKKVGANLNNLGQYIIKTNSTNSRLDIYACGICIKDL